VAVLAGAVLRDANAAGLPEVPWTASIGANARGCVVAGVVQAVVSTSARSYPC